MSGDAWFAGLDAADTARSVAAINDGRAADPDAWPELAVETGFAPDEQTYYEILHDAAIRAAESAAQDRSRAADRQLIHSVRALDDCITSANELAERLAEWAGDYVDDAGTGIEYARQLAERDPGDAVEARIVGLASRVDDLATERDRLRAYLENQAPAVAPNLSTLAGPVLAARLIALGGGLEALAKKPSGTLQVLGAEDALFAHLEGRASSPKHGVIYTHPAVRETHPSNRGPAARALAGKLAIAARIDHYAGDFRPALETDLEERIERIRKRDPE